MVKGINLEITFTLNWSFSNENAIIGYTNYSQLNEKRGCMELKHNLEAVKKAGVLL